MSTFYYQPILNSPYEEPSRHHALDERGLPTDKPPIEGRRSSALLSPIFATVYVKLGVSIFRCQSVY